MKCFSVQPKSGKDRNEKAGLDFSEGHHTLYFTGETKKSRVNL